MLVVDGSEDERANDADGMGWDRCIIQALGESMGRWRDILVCMAAHLGDVVARARVRNVAVGAVSDRARGEAVEAVGQRRAGLDRLHIRCSR
jgi:hypothetical protein